MTFSYDVTALSDELNRIRLEIGDTDSNRPLLQDEEIEEVISEITGFNLRVAKCFRLLAALFASGIKSIKMEGFSETYEGSYANFLGKAIYYENLGGGGGTPWAGSIDVAFKEATRADSSLVQPFFRRGLHDNR